MRQNAADVEVPNVRIWLESEVQLPEIDVRSSPDNRHSGQGPEGLRVTHSGYREGCLEPHQKVMFQAIATWSP